MGTSGFEQMMQGLNALGGAMKNFATTRAVGQAQDEVNQLNSASMDEMDKRNALSAVSQNLTMRLSGIGAEPQQIAQVSGAIKPAAFADAQDMFMASQQKGSSKLAAAAQATQKFEEDPKLTLQRLINQGSLNVANAKAQAGAGDLNEKQTRDLMRYQTSFNTAAKKSLDSSNQAQAVKDILASNNPLGDNAIPTFMARASGEVGNLSEADKKPFGSAQDIQSRLESSMKMYAQGKLTDDNRKFISQLADTMQKASLRAAGQHADRIARQAHALFPTHALPTLRRMIYDEDLGGTSPTGQTPAQAPAAAPAAAPSDAWKQWTSSGN